MSSSFDCGWKMECKRDSFSWKRCSGWKDAATRFQFAKFLLQNAILNIMLGASNITCIFLTFLTDKKICVRSPQWKSKQGFCHIGSNVTGREGFFSSLDKSQRSVKFSSFTLCVGKESRKRAQVSEGWSTYKTCVGQTCSCSAQCSGLARRDIILPAQHQAPAAPLPSTGAVAPCPVLPVRGGDVAVLWQGSSCRHGLCLHQALQEWLPQELLPFDPPSESVLARATWH